MAGTNFLLLLFSTTDGSVMQWPLAHWLLWFDVVFASVVLASFVLTRILKRVL